MGDYITIADIESVISDQRLRKLTDDDKTGAVVSSVVTDNIVRAEGEVNAYVSKKYDVPVTGTIPEPLKSWSIALASYFLYQRRPPIPEDIRLEVVAVRRQLEQCANGLITLDIGSSDAEESSLNEPEFQYNDREFTRTKYAGW